MFAGYPRVHETHLPFQRTVGAFATDYGCFRPAGFKSPSISKSTGPRQVQIPCMVPIICLGGQLGYCPCLDCVVQFRALMALVWFLNRLPSFLCNVEATGLEMFHSLQSVWDSRVRLSSSLSLATLPPVLFPTEQSTWKILCVTTAVFKTLPLFHLSEKIPSLQGMGLTTSWKLKLLPLWFRWFLCVF